MKYNLLLKALRAAMYGKRFVWWLGLKLARLLSHPLNFLLRPAIVIRYKLRYLLKKIGITTTREAFVKRTFLQLVLGLVLLGVTLPQTQLWRREDLLFSGQKTKVFALVGADEEGLLEEVVFASEPAVAPTSTSWRAGTLSRQFFGGTAVAPPEPDFTAVVAGGSAISQPILFPGARWGSSARTREVDYTVEPGDSLSAIAYQFGISVSTVMWANSLSLNSIIRPGDVLKIPPTDGVIHVVKKGETLKKIAARYQAKVETVIAFNHLADDGSDLRSGERLMIPGGVQPPPRVIVPPGARPAATRLAVPARSRATPSLAGFIWPSAATIITQYYGLRHRALDIAGPRQTPIYAAKAGVVEKSQCGWNWGYGCMVVVDHGNSVKTLYAHNSRLLVAVGEEVVRGQVIALIGRTGRTTGPHVHFELIQNGARINPLGYIR